MSSLQAEAAGKMLSVAGMDPGDWDLDELAEALEGQRSQVHSVRRWLDQTDEPALTFDPRWE